MLKSSTTARPVCAARVLCSGLATLCCVRYGEFTSNTSCTSPRTALGPTPPYNLNHCQLVDLYYLRFFDFAVFCIFFKFVLVVYRYFVYDLDNDNNNTCAHNTLVTVTRQLINRSLIVKI